MSPDLPELRRLAALPAEPPEGLATAVWEGLGREFGSLDDLAVAVPTDWDAPPVPAPPVTGRPPTQPVITPAPGWRRAPRRRVWALAVAVVAAVLTSTVVLTWPSTPSAFAVVSEARRHFAELPPLRVVVEHTTGAVALRTDVPSAAEDWVRVTELDFSDRTHYRQETVEERGAPAGSAQLGGFTVADGRVVAGYDARQGRLSVRPVEEGSGPPALALIDPELQGGPALDDEAIRRDCTVIADTVVAGRVGRRLSCLVGPLPAEGLPAGSRATVAIDRETGVVLAMAFPNGNSVRVRSIEYRPRFPEGRFTVEPPAGATVDWVGQAPPPPAYRTAALPGVLTVPVDASGLWDLAVGEGSLWATAPADLGPTPTPPGRVLRIDPRSGRVEEIPVSLKDLTDAQRRRLGDATDRTVAVPSNLAFAGGWLWVADFGAGTVERVDPAANRVVGEPIPVGLDPRLAAGAGSLWVLTGDEPTVRTFGGVGVGVSPTRLVRLDPVTGAVQAEIPLSDRSAWPGSVVATDDAVWATVLDVDPADPRRDPGVTLMRVDPAANRVVSRAPVRGTRLVVAAAALWTAYPGIGDGAAGAVERIDPDSGRSLVRIDVPGGIEDVVIVGSTLWATNPWTDTVTGIDLERGTVTGTRPTGDMPMQVATDGAALWVANMGGHTVMRIPV